METLLFVFSLMLFFSVFLPRKMVKVYFFLSCILLSYISYHIEIYEAMDLYRHHQQIDMIRRGVYTLSFLESKNPLFMLYLNLIVFIGDNAWLQTITVFTAYALITTIIYRYSERENLSHKYLLICFFFILFNYNYNWLVAGIRSYLGFAVLSFFLYMELIENKYKMAAWLVYIGMCFFHYIFIVFLLIRVLLIFKIKCSSFFINILLLFIVFLLPSVNNILLAFPHVTLFTIIAEKNIGYETYSTFGIWQYLMTLGKFFTLVILYLYYWRFCKNSKTIKYDNYVLMTIMLLLGTINKYQMFLRVTDFLLLLSIKCFVDIFKKERIKSGFASKKISSKEKSLLFALVILETIVILGFYMSYEYRYSIFFVF
jgi:hypothetical protein